MWSRELLIGALASGAYAEYDGPGAELVVRTYTDKTTNPAYSEWAEVICTCDCCCDNNSNDGFDRVRRQLVPPNNPCPNEIVIAIDTSFCNDNRVEQIRTTTKSLINAYADRQALGGELDEMRISLVTFDSDVEVIYGFDKYEEVTRFDQHRNNLESESARLEIQNEVTDYNHIFARLTETFEYNFRQEGRRSLIVYTNGNQHDAIDYDEINEKMRQMNVDVYGMAFSPQCSEEEKENPDHLCPDDYFFESIFGHNIFRAPDQTTLETLVRQTAHMDCPLDIEEEEDDEPCNDCSCECPFPVKRVPGEIGDEGPRGTPGRDGADGERGPAGRRGEPGRDGHDGPRGLVGAIGDRGRPGLAGERGPRGPPGRQGERGPAGRKGEPGDPAQSSQSEPGQPGRKGPDGPDGKNGADGRDGQPGPRGDRGQPGADGVKGPRGQPGRAGKDAQCNDGGKGPDGPPGLPGKNGEPGEDGEPGRPGQPGRRGEKGTSGVQGPTGDRGEPGEDGDAGWDGCAGSDGKPGRNGEPGVQGPQGPRGLDGEQGRKGDQGDAGSNGQPGPKGERGEPGNDGADGEDGCPGNNGWRGLRGETGQPGQSGNPGADGIPGAPGTLGCPGERGDVGADGTPGIIDELEIRALVVKAMREIHQECFGDDADEGDDFDPPHRGDDIDEML